MTIWQMKFLFYFFSFIYPTWSNNHIGRKFIYFFLNWTWYLVFFIICYTGIYLSNLDKRIFSLILFLQGDLLIPANPSVNQSDAWKETEGINFWGTYISQNRGKNGQMGLKRPFCLFLKICSLDIFDFLHQGKEKYSKLMHVDFCR